MPNQKTYAKYAIYSSGGFDADNNNIKNAIQMNEHQDRFRSIEMENLRQFHDYQVRMDEALDQIRNYGDEQHTEETDYSVVDEQNSIPENNDSE